MSRRADAETSGSSGSAASRASLVLPPPRTASSTRSGRGWGVSLGSSHSSLLIQILDVLSGTAGREDHIADRRHPPQGTLAMKHLLIGLLVGLASSSAFAQQHDHGSGK